MLEDEIGKTSKATKSLAAMKKPSKQSTSLSKNKKASEAAIFDPNKIKNKYKKSPKKSKSQSKKPIPVISDDLQTGGFNLINDEMLKPSPEKAKLWEHDKSKKEESNLRVWKIFDNFIQKENSNQNKIEPLKSSTIEKKRGIMHDIDEIPSKKPDFKSRAIASVSQNKPISYEGVIQNPTAKEILRHFTPSANVYSQATYKLITAHSEDLTEKLIDDLLIEMVFILNKAEDDKRIQEASEKQKHLFYDYLETINDYVYETSTLNSKLGKTNYKVDNTLYKYGRSLINSSQNYLAMNETKIHVSINKDIIKDIREERLKFQSIQHKQKMYGDKYIKGFLRTSELILDEELAKIAKEFDEVQNFAIEKMIKDEFN